MGATVTLDVLEGYGNSFPNPRTSSFPPLYGGAACPPSRFDRVHVPEETGHQVEEAAGLGDAHNPPSISSRSAARV